MGGVGFLTIGYFFNNNKLLFFPCCFLEVFVGGTSVVNRIWNRGPKPDNRGLM